MLKSFKFPIGVATMYNPGFIISLIILFIFLNSCSPVNFPTLKNTKVINENNTITNEEDEEKNEIIIKEVK